MTLIFIIDDEKVLLDMLSASIPSEYKIKTFTNKEDLLKCKDEFKEVCLFIIDIVLDGNDGTNGIDLSNELFDMGFYQPRLFMSGFYDDYDFVKLSESIKGKYVFDFITKPSTLEKFNNRIKILTQIYEYHEHLVNEKERNIDVIWEMLNYSLVYIVIIAEDFEIKLANYALAKTLGFDSEKDLVGMNWGDFTDPTLKDVLKDVHKDIINGGKEFKEFTNFIFTKDKKPIKVKWFNSSANNNSKLCVSIGVPYKEIDVNESIDSIRSYFRDVVEQDNTMIQAIKKTMLKKESDKLKTNSYKKE